MHPVKLQEPVGFATRAGFHTERWGLVRMMLIRHAYVHGVPGATWPEFRHSGPMHICAWKHF